MGLKSRKTAEITSQSRRWSLRHGSDVAAPSSALRRLPLPPLLLHVEQSTSEMAHKRVERIVTYNINVMQFKSTASLIAIFGATGTCTHEFTLSAVNNAVVELGESY